MEAWGLRMGDTTNLYKDVTKAKWPFVSVIIPAHNEESVLAATLESCCNQVYTGDKPEIIVALNGCHDRSREVARRFPIKILDERKCGMGFGKNLGASAATGDILLFVDADTTLPASAIQQIVQAMRSHTHAVCTVSGCPESGGPMARACFHIANWYARRKRVQSIGPVLAVNRTVFDAIHGFDERIKQSVGTDFIMRALAMGAEYLFLDTVCATTSIRRFKRVGMLRQLLSWRANHRLLAAGRHDELQRREYDTIR